MNKQDIKNLVSKVEKEDSIFTKKVLLDSLSYTSGINGRNAQTEKLVRYLVGYKQGYVVPYISVYGRSGSGKSSVVRFVCSNVDGVSFCFVNLRQAKTVFGAANLILAELGLPNLKSAQGINHALDDIGKAIESVIKKTGQKLFVLILDELDTIFYDKRGKPSDFIYKLIILEEKLRQKEILLCVIGISNNVLSEYELDDRVKSRIGSSEIFFEPYSKSDVFDILKDRAKEAFAKKLDKNVLEYCAELSAAEHGDARRAIDLLRVSAEIANSKGEDLSIQHVDLASEELQKDRVSLTLSSASYHLRLVCGAIARITYLTGEPWHSTSVLYAQYVKILQKGTKPLSYRRVSDLLTDLENTGLVVSQTSSRGRHGYGSLYKIIVSPEMVGRAVSVEWWDGIVKAKLEHDGVTSGKKTRLGQGSRHFDNLLAAMQENNELAWKQYVGLE
ncbi:MAG TPA: AAA family ATPase [Candidatus Nitrosotalea sp.]|nr:AAA family ATPase [Candidatus Nitrosotalea sp.]